MGKVICIVGSAPTTRNLAPVGDPAVQIWSLNDCWMFLPASQCHLWFELHPREHFAGPARPPGHLEWLQHCPIPVLMPEVHPDIPTSVAYPEDQIVADLGCRRYFTSSVAYMLALACHDLTAGDEVHLYGVDLSTEVEYTRQRPCVEYWCGRMESKGIRVVTPKGCPLLAGPRYGVADPEEEPRQARARLIEERLRLLTADKARLGAEFNRNQGRIDEAMYLRSLVVEP